MGWKGVLAAAIVGAAATAMRAADLELTDAIATVKQVGGFGAGNQAAQQAWPVLAAASPEELPVLLAAIDDCNPLAANWLRSAVDAVSERTLARGKKLPNQELEAFVLDTKHAPRARRLAFEWLVKVDASATDRLIPGMLNDPSMEFRRDAVARLLDDVRKLEASGKTGDEVQAAYRTALGGARDLDQVQAIAAKLKELGDEVDLSRHFGFLYDWRVIGPFDNTGTKGFAVAYPPEKEIKLDAEYAGKNGLVTWQRFTSIDDMGAVDLNAILAKEKGVAAYLVTEFVSDHERPAEFRWGSVNATKLWLNGELLGEHEVYHTGDDLDQYVGKGKLKAGKNVVLMKVCQNEQTEDWAETWKVALRVCDSNGTAILSSDRPEKSPKTAAEKL